MSMSSALSNVFSRHRARYESERLANDHQEEDDVSPSSENSITEDDHEETNSLREEEQDEEQGGGEEEREENDEVPHTATGTTVTLAELEEERELARRRSSACVLLAVFVLFRLWIEAINDGDFGLLLLCLVGTSWTARWIRHNREREEELDRRIANYLNADPSTTEVNRNDLRMLSFQAQLALAIMESQRQMMEGGYGHPDGEGERSPGVSEEARSKWNHFRYKDPSDAEKKIMKETYGSVSENDPKKDGLDDAPHCSICLGEYEEGEEIAQLPCQHIYHDECIGSWCSNHTKCPLCNYDLESARGESPPDDSIV